MELVYLWVEEYKNIKEQGFNFSPRFDCKYDKDSNKLTIDEKKDYVSIFPDNINVTAIVGENGSGKSSICNSLVTSQNGIIQIYRINEKFYYFDSKVVGVRYPKYFKKSNLNDIEQIKFSYDFFSQAFINNSNRDFSYSAKDVFNEIFDYSYENIDLVIYKSLISKVLYKHGKKVTTLSGYTNLVTSITLRINNYFDIYKRDRLEESIKLSTTFHNINIDDKFKTLPNDKKFLLYIIYLINENEIGSGNPYWLSIFTSFEDMIYTTSGYLSLTDDPDILVLINNYIKYCEFLELFDASDKILDVEISPLSDELLFTRNFYPLLELSYFDELGRQYDKLSHGERQIHSSMLLLYDKIINSNDNHIEIIIDEIETSLHPKWQKSLVLELIKLCTNFVDKKFHIIISSHSPFILSDLPKENVIFLKDGKQKFPFQNSQTFGANIHTLLSDGFFMSDGLMGEFAKSKITKVIELLKKDSLSEHEIKKCKHIISIIGEPILQKTLEHQLNAKLNPNETELQKLQREQEEIEEKIALLKKKNDEAN